MSGTDSMDEEVHMDGGTESIVTDAIPFREIAYPSNNNAMGIGESNRHVSPGTSASSAIQLNVSKNDKCYYMNHKKRGTALLFNMEKIPNLEIRRGSARDLERLSETFRKLGFEVMPYTDGDKKITVDSLKSILKNAAVNADSESDCLVLVFMSHGEMDDKLWAYDKRFFAKELWEPFFADKCPALAGKPKLFFIQACRGNQLETSTYVKDAGTKKDTKATYTLPNQSDILIAHSTIEGRQSVRHVNDGAWFIQSLCNELDENGRNESILSLLTSVNRRVALDYEAKKREDQILKQQPVIISTLTRELFF